MVLITGAGGKTGQAIIKALSAHGEACHAFVHRETHAARIQALGANAASVGSLEDVDAIAGAADGADTIYHICPNVSPREWQFACNTVAAATRAGLRRFIYHSVLHPQIEAMPHHWRKMRVEEMLFASGLDVTILQPTVYMQNILASWPAIVTTGVHRVPYPAATRLSLVDLDDVATAAVEVATTDGHVGATYELAGTAPLSQREVADIIASVLQRPVRAEEETAEAWAARATAAGMSDDQRDTLVKMFRYYAEHGLVGNPNVLKWLLRREPTSLAGFIARTTHG
jgi:NAD(P)H dehydrogenase (quinone)